ncbi:hypothetical protein EYF80_010882 [Liparis tanakae]|uniref:Uncharacterized protein n=1 Tax=Liparis tanakae TaxID=230148 RepID=A0A4Z2IM27_9TELE|nr:hypothetical protein EYF80_010882 [Liparis tanakae]
MCEANVLRVTREAGSTVPVCPSGNPTKAAPHWMEGKIKTTTTTNTAQKESDEENLTGAGRVRAAEGGGGGVDVQQGAHLQHQQEERQRHALGVQQQQADAQQPAEQQQRGGVDRPQPVGLHGGPPGLLGASAQLPVVQRAPHALVDLRDEVVQLGLGADARAGSVARRRRRRRTAGRSRRPGLREHGERVEPDQGQAQRHEAEGGPGQDPLGQDDQLGQVPEAVLGSGADGPVERQAHGQQREDPAGREHRPARRVEVAVVAEEAAQQVGPQGQGADGEDVVEVLQPAVLQPGEGREERRRLAGALLLPTGVEGEGEVEDADEEPQASEEGEAFFPHRGRRQRRGGQDARGLQGVVAGGQQQAVPVETDGDVERQGEHQEGHGAALRDHVAVREQRGAAQERHQEVGGEEAPQGRPAGAARPALFPAGRSASASSPEEEELRAEGGGGQTPHRLHVAPRPQLGGGGAHRRRQRRDNGAPQAGAVLPEQHVGQLGQDETRQAGERQDDEARGHLERVEPSPGGAAGVPDGGEVGLQRGGQLRGGGPALLNRGEVLGGEAGELGLQLREALGGDVFGHAGVRLKETVDLQKQDGHKSASSWLRPPTAPSVCPWGGNTGRSTCPTLLYGMGTPSSRARVGTRSVWGTTSGSLYKREVKKQPFPSATNLGRRRGEQGGGTVEEDGGVRLLLTFPAVIPGVRHPVVTHHHQQGVVLQPVDHRPGRGDARMSGQRDQLRGLLQ